MRLRDRLHTVNCYIAFAFYPATALIACALLAIFINAALVIIMIHLPENSAVYNILFALITGATASFFVSVVIELSNNYKNNKLAWQELQEYYNALHRYELMKQVLMQRTPSQVAKKIAVNEFLAQGGKNDDYDNDTPDDIVQATWKELPEIIPVLLETLQSKKQFLTGDEIINLRYIASAYEEIRQEVGLKLSHTLQYNTLNHPDEECLKGIYPQNILEDMPEWIRKYLAKNISEKATDTLTDAIMADSFLLGQYMQDYDISLLALKRNETISDEDGAEDVCSVSQETPDESAECDEVDEEAFKKHNRKITEDLERRMVSFVSWYISRNCLNISESIDVLEKHVLKKPYAGFMLRYTRNDTLKNPHNDFMYQATMQELEKNCK